jgi:hypothetical protein
MSRHKSLWSLLTGSLLAGALLLVGALPSAAAAQDVDARWLPWLGCWEASDGGEEVPMLCVKPLEGEEGVELTTWSDGELISTEAIYTDGQIRDSSREGCVGQEEAGFSDDGRRIYLKSTYVCEGGVQRGATGLLAFANPMEWLDIKLIDVAGEKVPMVLRYRAARASRVEAAGMAELVAPRAMSVKAARIAASARLTPEDLIEASRRVDGKAVEALIVERGDPFDVDSDMLVRLADAGVGEGVIDLAIAVSYPNRFVVNSGAPEEVRDERTRTAMPLSSFGYRSRWSFWDPFYYDPFYYSSFGYSYSPFYYNYGWYSGYYRPINVQVESRPTVEHGRVINGQGYRRGTSSSSGSAGRMTPSTRTTPTTRSGSSGRSGSGAMTSGGARSGSSSSSTGRTAKRRGGGGGL